MKRICKHVKGRWEWSDGKPSTPDLITWKCARQYGNSRFSLCEVIHHSDSLLLRSGGNQSVRSLCQTETDSRTHHQDREKRTDKSKLLSVPTEVAQWRKNIWTTLKNNVEDDLRRAPWMQTSTEAMNILCHIEILRVQLHTSQILIILGLFLILLCCLLQRVSDLDAVHLPRNSYLLITLTYSLIIQLWWLWQKCLSHHFSGYGARYRHRSHGHWIG